ncbi:MAG TPA: ATP-binding cassette domain-containing protein [Edaphobacter sp.]|nr:ATP-binding cassette domain-containing protein [Edaphobacter sp.]
MRIKHYLGSLPLDVSFSLTQPWTVLFGPSGSGKTTILRCIAGFVRPDSGQIVCGPQTLFDSVAKISVPAHRRPIRSAGQAARLFPHMTVRWNLVYGSSSKAADVMGIAEELMAAFGLKGLEDRMPDQLSGGERQRAVVIRAVMAATTFDGSAKPLLLLDEPFSGLDLAMRDELVGVLQSWQTRWKIPVFSVTHTLGEAFQLGAQVIKIADGRVIEQGAVEVVLADERARLLEQLKAGVENRP